MDNVFKSMGKNYSFLIGAQVIYKTVMFFVMIFLARFLGPEGFGQFSYAISFVAIFLFVSDLGLSELFIKDVSADRKLLNDYMDNIVTMKVLAGALAYCMLGILAFYLSGSSIKFWAIMILGASIILDSFMYFFRCIFRIREVMKKEAMLLIVEAFLKLAVLFFIINYIKGGSGVLLVSIGFLCVSILNLFISFFTFVLHNRMPCFRLNKGMWVYLFKNGLPIAGVYVLCFINFRINIIMLSTMKSDIVAGFYNADFKLMEQVLMIPMTFSFVVLPFFSRLSGSVDIIRKLLIRIFFWLFCMGTLSVACFYIFGQKLVNIIYGNGFEGAVKHIALFSWILIPFFVKPVLEKVFYSIGKQALLLGIYFIATIANILFNSVMIPKFGMKGAIITTFSIESVIVAGSALFLFSLISKGTEIKMEKLC
jgi:O-antigen/teichoic acid export membrane protein